MPTTRPVRVYRFTFTQGEHTLLLTHVGHTPCAARARAYAALERTLHERPELPRDRWRLRLQEDITSQLPPDLPGLAV